ncbi:MAG: hypothetical protein HC904_08230 [Blastochloris sp.]|nr:hypothetical protein [Blastochloris sp.]
MPRACEVRHIFVAEPWDTKRQVKAQGVGEVSVLKLNQILSIPTGTYTYQQMHSSFVRRRDGQTLKFSMGSQEACGITYKAGFFHADSLRVELRSYFDGEGDSALSLPLPAGPSLSYDEIPLRLRLIAGRVLARPQPLRSAAFRDQSPQRPVGLEPGGVA